MTFQVQEWRVRAPCGPETSRRPWHGSTRCHQASLRAPLALLAGASVAATSGAPPRSSYAEIAGMRDYYGYLAADKLNEGYNLNIHPSQTSEAQAALSVEPDWPERTPCSIAT